MEIIVVCPNCKNEGKLNTVYDDHFDEQVTCDKCNFTVSKWCFEFKEDLDGQE